MSGPGIDVVWTVAAEAEVPPGDDWLGPRERALLARLQAPVRRASWRLGRYAAKRLLGDVEVLPEDAGARGGPPVAWRGPERLPVSLSLSHRDGVAMCAALAGAGALGCDLERVERRGAAFLDDFLTAAERAAVAASDPAALANLIWSAKESALKALRCGLGRDTWELEVTVGAAGAPWGELVVADLPNRRTLSGLWCRLDDFVLTLVSDSPLSPRRRDPPSEPRSPPCTFPRAEPR